jgi:acyl-coenzyme A synthetase/AMP-(fatty) acid ligase
VTILPLVPPVFLLIAKEPTLAQYDLSSLKGIGSGAAPLGPVVEEALKARFSFVYFFRLSFKNYIFETHNGKSLIPRHSIFLVRLYP